MSRILKIGFSAAMNCLQQTNRTIHGVIIGTGKGCLTDTELFLQDIVKYHETALNAMPFIQSTYNQLNGMIGLSQKIDSYSNTYVHRAFALEHALLDAWMWIQEKENQNILVGCYDEMTIDHFKVKKQWGYWKEESIESSSLITSQTKGTIAGEGAGFFILSDHGEIDNQNAILDIQTFYKPTPQDIEEAIIQLYTSHQIKASDIDLLILGKSGDTDNDSFYTPVEKMHPESIPVFFKHLCGEYDTAINLAIWLANSILTYQEIPALCKPLNLPQKNKFEYVLLYNNYFNINHSLILIRKMG